MITLNSLEKVLTSLLLYDKNLKLEKIDPFMINGLQVKGTEKIKKIGLGVSASIKLFKKAVDKKCQAVIVHHAINLPPFNRYDQIFQDRFSYLLKHQLSLFGFHFLLDSHPKIGHNAQIVKLLGATELKPFLFKEQPWGFEGKVNNLELKTIIKILRPHLSKQTVIYPFGPRKINKIVVVSGKGTPYSGDMENLISKKIDLYITGEPAEWIRELFEEAKINFIAGGHYYTERFGLLALAKLLKGKLPVQIEFLELENEI